MSDMYDIIVHKANIPLQSGESLYQFTSSVGSAGKEYIFQKQNLTKADVYCQEVFADKAIFSVWKYKDQDLGSGRTEHYYLAVKFSRSTDGTFSFTESLKVKPVTSYVEDKGLKVTKSAEPAVWDMDNWTFASKSLFAGVV